ncbi:sigma-54-dependent Fis family transcriptional regulator [Pelotomaculum terephthalicicum JT]|uniref:sigma-54 interaction domain-containing protein n=1 Tax=Pelotomaculum terephthalicicum TaxID=206393 RepID=UPI001F040D10|nr:sigma-54-dependent Fis family transcriptional regulator [Pelotomaculum terephthalicicum]MCG9968855.1 sigma-54-dependent Fis family transcriptional regulator [Pelotomaculum terephthalicicum JT]
MQSKNTHATYEAILDASNDALVAVNKTCMVTLFNQAAEKTTGLKAADVLGKPLADDFPVPALPQMLQTVLQTGTAELNHQLRSGDLTIVASFIPLKDRQGKITGAAAIMGDITSLRSLERQVAELKETRSLLEAILYATEDAITVVNEKGNGILINPAYTKITGLTEADVINKPASVAVTEGESMHLKVLQTRQLVRGVRLKMGPMKKEVVVNVAPIIMDGILRGSVGVIHDITEIMHLSEELANVKKLIRRLQAKYTFDDIIGNSEPIQAAIAQARHASDTPATVLLRGESGTGKELFAHAIHNVSGRSKGPFVRVNCVAIAESLLESELFGYEEGAFTGAIRGGKKGYFEDASDGTIFLDEIGDMNLALQAKILRVLQEKEIIRVGGTRPIPVNVRIIAATNANLEQRISEGTFREDLYYRLNVVPIFVPPLRVRKDDIPLLTTHLVKKLEHEYKRKISKISPAVFKILMNYDWPGNIRELENMVGRTIIKMDKNEEIILSRHVPEFIIKRTSMQRSTADNRFPKPATEIHWEGSLGNMLDMTEKNILLETLQRTNGNKTKAANLLGIAVRSLYYKMEKHGLA